MALSGIVRAALSAWHRSPVSVWDMGVVLPRGGLPGPDKPEPWGDGIVDGSLADLWSAQSWNDVSDDELVFLIPNLLSSLAHKHKADGPADRTYGILASRACSEALALASVKQKVGCLSELERWCREGVLAAATAKEILAEGWRDKPQGGICAQGGADTFPRMVVAELDGFHRDARLPLAQRAPATQAQAMFRSIHSGLNAAYVYEAFAPLHETLGVGAWIGHVLRGRSALLPPCIAEPLAGLVAGSPANPMNEETDPLAALLKMHLGPLALDRLRRAATRSLRSGRPIVVDAVPFTAPSQAATKAMLTLLAKRS